MRYVLEPFNDDYSVPKYVRIKQILSDLIKKKKGSTAYKLPSELRLMKEYSVSRGMHRIGQ